MIFSETEEQWEDRATRWVWEFAFLPTRMTDGRMIWFEWYLQRWDRGTKSYRRDLVLP